MGMTQLKIKIIYTCTYSLLGDVTVCSLVHWCQCFREACYFWLHYYPLYQEWKTTGTSPKPTEVVLSGISDRHKRLQIKNQFFTQNFVRQRLALATLLFFGSTRLCAFLSQYLTNLMHKICFTISFISCLHMFRAHVLIITPIGGCLVHKTATYRCDDTRGYVMQFWPSDDECTRNM